jgi:glycosyltransferase involved in cell wall biosynthesis
MRGREEPGFMPHQRPARRRLCTGGEGPPRSQEPIPTGRFIGDMSNENQPTISAVVAAYQAEQWIAEALQAILGQTRPPDEVIVVDDGSTDGTAEVLERFADRVKIVRRANGGCPAAFNTAFSHATGDFVALCGSDDVWVPEKLEWQMETIERHPEVDVLCGDARLFGRVEGSYSKPPGTGVLDSAALTEALYRANIICAPSVVIRRSLFEALGPFVENFGADDYEYWMRCLRAGARFYYDTRPLLGWRQHDNNLSSKEIWMLECSYEVRRRYADDVADRAVVHEMLAADLFKIGRTRVDEGRPQDARKAFAHALRHASGAGPSANARALTWVAVLSLPAGARERAGRAFVGLSRALEGPSDAGQPALS